MTGQVPEKFPSGGRYDWGRIEAKVFEGKRGLEEKKKGGKDAGK